MRSTVEIRARQSRGSGRAALGTGVVLNADGLIVTNDHVLTLNGDAPAAYIRVIRADGRSVPAEIVGRSQDRDLAFLRADLDDAVPAELQPDLGEVSTGMPVIAIGAPRHFDEPMVEGEVTRVLNNARIRGYPGLRQLIVTSADLEQGFSGGPLADAEGQVIGINVATAVREDGETQRSLSIPAALVLDTAARLDVPVSQTVRRLAWTPALRLLPSTPRPAASADARGGAQASPRTAAPSPRGAPG
jgi:S1-C subfamily serine protease